MNDESHLTSLAHGLLLVRVRITKDKDSTSTRVHCRTRVGYYITAWVPYTANTNTQNTDKMCSNFSPIHEQVTDFLFSSKFYEYKSSWYWVQVRDQVMKIRTRKVPNPLPDLSIDHGHCTVRVSTVNCKLQPTLGRAM